jgi:hypothetical protein
VLLIPDPFQLRLLLMSVFPVTLVAKRKSDHPNSSHSGKMDGESFGASESTYAH